ncbi:hypothetical protein [Desertivirga brevis]|uniref:hypothetical protein n=1 Tax=Desertivirga brevis TaxID=2810310 RepID=UPI001A960A85|nr:hypothetical protein [Pedobacter sp. SYSU D00873]
MMNLIVEKEDESTDRMRRLGYKIIVDPIVFKVAEVRKVLSPGAMIVGTYHFLDSIVVDYNRGTGTAYLRARAAAIIKVEDKTYGVVDHFNVSNLLSGFSAKVVGAGKIKGYDLYENFSGDNDMDKKRNYIENHIINNAIEVVRETSPNCIEWRFIKKSEYMARIQSIAGSLDFTEYLSAKEYELIKD